MNVKFDNATWWPAPATNNLNNRRKVKVIIKSQDAVKLCDKNSSEKVSLKSSPRAGTENVPAKMPAQNKSPQQISLPSI